ncbi:hypothetical protein ABB37_07012 [Leptomonas pyrrhocoris]|uniref:Uncharacterized protein n=1 Tax=Leptomonas pyrrhocoris TaxID=157538 RepID=A0A0N0DTL6_LEPPY|nr:hypothetical protein ABB37_07012 [Leptomonas pyrrhocoris]XP_015656108.1 hypothetical protein ABB37_07012 [Leptomonas pyrrhocoris]KPA77668.1 hypothetical protein ABB37_07012 [Leptomonas pyrrhocoris]KPA77669.1 hypothetical protein ABB37_07012 [Leptomonas pyrrhocoris]|eukprot:XP_015656107.1 hypothetical protein ABB37_07012 [Leptomonas pyrrhocoris]
MPNLPEHSEATSPHAASANPPLLLPLVAHRFYTDFMARLSAQQRSSAPRSTTSAYGDSSSGNGKKTKTHNGTDGSGGAEEEEEEEDAALRRLSRAQCDAVGPLLWQWLLLLHATAQESRANDNEQHHLSEVDVEEHRADPSHTQALLPPRSRLHTPGQVEQLFQTGLSSLVPAAVGRGAAAAVRTPTADLPAPWHATKDEPYASPSSPYADAHRSLVRALVRLSTNGPLFSSWCALCYECMFALPSVEVAAEAEQRGGGGVEACHPTAPVAVARVQDAWDTACAPYSRGKKTQTVGEGQKTHGNAHPAHQASISGQSNTDDAGASLDAATVAQLWQEVYKHTATNHTGRAGSPGESSAASHAHPLFPLWVSQWYVECCRIASHGRDDGFQVKSVPFTVLRRVMHYLCRRLIEEEEEVVVVGEGSPRLLREMPVSASTTTASTSSVIGESTTKGHRAASSTRQSAPLTVATLTGLALKAPAVDGAGKQRRATREGKRRRGWHDSDDDNDEDGDSSQEKAKSMWEIWCTGDQAGVVALLFSAFYREVSSPTPSLLLRLSFAATPCPLRCGHLSLRRSNSRSRSAKMKAVKRSKKTVRCTVRILHAVVSQGRMRKWRRVMTPVMTPYASFARCTCATGRCVGGPWATPSDTGS